MQIKNKLTSGDETEVASANHRCERCDINHFWHLHGIHTIILHHATYVRKIVHGEVTAANDHLPSHRLNAYSPWQSTCLKLNYIKY